ncbi:MAG TPA: SDR family NAD(P)-dependent oxidoreductase, partial [Chloroflexota bacterium]|nr:SDR family NAD(P)-dependent oxidoreductase [Chloroflexota bacterium]
MGQLEGKVAVITGAASGIGRATARLFAAEGARVALGDRQAGPLEALAGEIRDGGGQVVARPADVSRRDEAQALVRAAADAFGGLDVAVNNAGIGLYNTTLEATA